MAFWGGPTFLGLVDGLMGVVALGGTWVLGGHGEWNRAGVEYLAPRSRWPSSWALLLPFPLGLHFLPLASILWQAQGNFRPPSPNHVPAPPPLDCQLPTLLSLASCLSLLSHGF